MVTSVVVQCPYCFEHIDFYVDPETHGGFVEDCEVCCRPWQVHVSREREELHATVTRAQ